jgi:hypothetical protein
MPPFLRYDLDGAYPIAMRHSINYPSMKKFKNLFLNDLSHLIINPTLGFPSRHTRRIGGNTMSAEGRTNTIKVFKSVAKDRSVLF